MSLLAIIQPIKQVSMADTRNNYDKTLESWLEDLEKSQGSFDEKFG